jgi:hypothetical protein
MFWISIANLDQLEAHSSLALLVFISDFLSANSLTGIVFGSIASVYGGPISGFTAAIIVSAFRAFLGGLGGYVGIAGIIGGCLTEILFYKRKSTKPIPHN